MNETEFIQFVEASVARMTSNIGRIGCLVCTQSRNGKEPTVREPELRSAFQQQAELDRLYYGIEVPTKYQYRFTGEGHRKALIYFALLTTSAADIPDVVVEFKEGQPQSNRRNDGDTLDFPAITKDFHKLWAEPSKSGRCMVHICQVANAGTLSAVLSRYKAVIHLVPQQASDTLLRSGKTPSEHVGRFYLFVLILHGRGETAAPALLRLRLASTS